MIASDNLWVTENSDVPVALTSFTGMELISEDCGPSSSLNWWEEILSNQVKINKKKLNKSVRIVSDVLITDNFKR